MRDLVTKTRDSKPQVTLSFALECDPEAPRRARRVVSGLEAVLPPPIIHDLGVVVTELVSNAVRFGPPAPIGVAVDVQADGGVRGAVADGGVGTEILDRGRDLGDGGLGLLIVDALCTRWGAEHRPNRVWFELEAADPGPLS